MSMKSEQNKEVSRSEPRAVDGCYCIISANKKHGVRVWNNVIMSIGDGG